MKIAIFDAKAHSPGSFDVLREQHDVTVFDGRFDLAAAHLAEIAHTEVLSVFVHSQLDRAELSALPALRLIATRSTGFDHIDTEYCRSRSIAVANVPNYGERTVAEHAFALLLAVSRRLPDAAGRTRAGRFDTAGLEGFDLAGRTIGIIGTGSIGANAIRIAAGFGMRVLATDIAPDPRLSREFAFDYVGLDALLAESDVISLHVPATPHTVNMLSAAAFDRMKTGVVIINTARGNLIDPAALLRALQSGKVAGAGLDVLPEEALLQNEAAAVASGRVDPGRLATLAADHALCAMPNVVVTPHTAFYTREAIGRIAAETIENIRAFCRGEPRNLVVTGADLAAPARRRFERRE